LILPMFKIRISIISWSLMLMLNYLITFSVQLIENIYTPNHAWNLGFKYCLWLWLCRYSGFYKGIQSAGAAVAWQIDNHNVSAMVQLIVNWVLTTVSYPLLLVLVVLAVKEENKGEEEQAKQVAPSWAENSLVHWYVTCKNELNLLSVFCCLIVTMVVTFKTSKCLKIGLYCKCSWNWLADSADKSKRDRLMQILQIIAGWTNT